MGANMRKIILLIAAIILISGLYAQKSAYEKFMGVNGGRFTGYIDIRDSLNVDGSVNLGDSSVDVTKIYSSVQTRQGASNYPIIKAGATTKPYWWIIANRLSGWGTVGEYAAMFANCQNDTIAVAKTVVGIQSKATSIANMSGASKLVGLYAKTSNTGTSTITEARGVWTLNDAASGATCTNGYGIYAEKGTGTWTNYHESKAADVVWNNDGGFQSDSISTTKLTTTLFTLSGTLKLPVGTSPTTADSISIGGTKYGPVIGMIYLDTLGLDSLKVYTGSGWVAF